MRLTDLNEYSHQYNLLDDLANIDTPALFSRYNMGFPICLFFKKIPFLSIKF